MSKVKTMILNWLGVGSPDPGNLVDGLRGAFPSNYTNQDRHRDFRRVFMGGDEGRRVLWEILGWCHVYKRMTPFESKVPIDIHRVMEKCGEKNIGDKILRVVTIEPGDRISKTTNKETE